MEYGGDDYQLQSFFLWNLKLAMGVTICDFKEF